MPTGAERELDLLLTKLQKILKEIGHDANDIESGAKGSKEDKFNLLKTAIMRRLTETCELMEKSSATGGTGFTAYTADPKAVIKRNQDIRSNLRSLDADWTEMDSIFHIEKNKRRSKMTKEEMDDRRQLLVDLKREIVELKSLNQQAAVGATVSVGHSAFASLPAGDVINNKNGSSDVRAATLTSEQHNRILQIKERSKEMEATYLTKIEDHVDRLGDLARGMNEELVLQERMMEDLDHRLEVTQENIGNMNIRMKDTLEKVRAADKFCVDIMCVLLLLGLVAVLYAVIKTGV